MSFALDVKAFTAKAGNNAELAIKRIIAGVADSVIHMSPVGDASYWQSPPPKGYSGGRFRGNWDYGFRSPPSGTFNVIDKTGDLSMSRITLKMPEGKLAGSIHWIANNLPYARRLEDGWSRQAPQGMVGITVLQFQQIVNESVGGLA
jgi:hypothetical protein